MDQQDPEDDGSAASWLRHPFGRSFDLISSEYGWTDGQILDLTLTRMRFARDMIWARQKEQRDAQVTLAEAVVKHLVVHIRSAAGDRNAGKAAARIRLFKAEKKPVAVTVDTIARKFGGSPGANEIDPDLFAKAYGPR